MCYCFSGYNVNVTPFKWYLTEICCNIFPYLGICVPGYMFVYLWCFNKYYFYFMELTMDGWLISNFNVMHQIFPTKLAHHCYILLYSYITIQPNDFS